VENSTSGYASERAAVELPDMGRRGHGEGSIRRRSDGRWEVRVRVEVDGQRRRLSLYGETRSEVVQKLRATVDAQQRGQLRMDRPESLGVFLDRWLESVRPRLAPKTFIAYEMYVKRHIVPDLGRIRIDRLGPERVQALLDRKLSEGLAPQSVVHIRGILRRALGRAVRFGLAARNVAALTDPPKVVRGEVRALDADEARAFLRAIVGVRLEALYLLALTTGLRQRSCWACDGLMSIWRAARSEWCRPYSGLAASCGLCRPRQRGADVSSHSRLLP